LTFDKTRLSVAMSTRIAITSNSSGGCWTYREVEQAQVFEAPIWASRRGLPVETFPVGVRLHLGESRAALLIFTLTVDVVHNALDGHGVKVVRSPIKLSPMLIGRK
jgi:hypothetical protein